ncbi:hypothetical protein MTO96_002703 [Rhipicephalus appendiculatus]
MAAGKLSLLFVFLILVGIICGIVAAVFGYILLSSSLNWPTEKWEYKSLAIVCDAKECANVALRIFGKGGTMIDAAVAALLCMGVTAPHLSGVGGGFLALIYNRTTGAVLGVNALGVSPAATKPDDFKNWTLTKIGYKAPIIPGAVAGYKLLHDNFGKLPWADLFTEAIRLADKGFTVGRHLAEALKRNQKDLSYDAKGRKVFLNTGTDELVAADTLLRLPRVGEVLRRIASNPTTLYTGPLGQEMEADFKREGGYITWSELQRYKANFVHALRAEIGDNKVVYSAAFPGSGAIVGAILDRFKITRSILQGKGKSPPVLMKDTYLHMLVETIKFALAFRENLGDTDTAISEQNKLLSKIQIRFRQRFLASASLGELRRLRRCRCPGRGLRWSASLHPGPQGERHIRNCGLEPRIWLQVLDELGNPAEQLHERFLESQRSIFEVSVGSSPAPPSSPLHSCVAANVPVRPYLGEHGYVVQVGPNTATFDPASLLLKMGHTVEKEPVFTSSATAIVTTGRNSWMAPVDTLHTDGSTAGYHYEHPVIKNDRLNLISQTNSRLRRSDRVPRSSGFEVESTASQTSEPKRAGRQSPTRVQLRL